MSQFDDFIAAVKEGATPLIGDFAGGLKDEALNDLTSFLAAKAHDLQEWTGMLARGEITRLEFEMMVKGAKSLLELRGLRIAGVQLARLQRLRDGIINLVIDKALGTFLP